jgi:hypothetical protein
MSQLLTFFKGSDTRFGVFYPIEYLLAAFPNWATAQKVRRTLYDSGWPDDELVAVPGEDVVHFAQEHLKKDGLWGLLMTELSRFIHTEAPYADHDLELARQGAGFVAVHCPSEHKREAAWNLIAPSQPIVCRYYGSGAIEHFAGET